MRPTVFFAFIVSFILLFSPKISAHDAYEMLENDTTVYDLDSLLQSVAVEVKPVTQTDTAQQDVIVPDDIKVVYESHPLIIVSDYLPDTIITHTPVKKPDTIDYAKFLDISEALKNPTPIVFPRSFLSANPLFIDLVFHGLPLQFNWELDRIFSRFYFNSLPKNLENGLLRDFQTVTAEQSILNLRQEARNMLTRSQPHVYAFRPEQLPDPNNFRQSRIETRNIDRVRFVEDDKILRPNSKIEVAKLRRSPWTKRAVTMLQVSQNYVSKNWYQGGNSTTSILSILTGQLNYDNKKSIQWENNGEWRTGFYSVLNDTTALRTINTNEDILKYTSKLGIKAGGKWFYTGTFDFSTHFLNSFSSPSSNNLRASLFAPVRVNVGTGLDFKHKKVFSMLFAPISYKYIYLNINENREFNVNPRSFGIPVGEKVLSQLGSSIRIQHSYAPSREIQIDSKFVFYTNYEKFEADLEIVGNFMINRYLSTRILLNPRYDNTVILNGSEKARIQIKELMTFGISYKFQ